MNKTVLVTGAAGFIGSHLVEACVRAGVHVRAFVHYNSSGRLGWLDESPDLDNIEVIAGDVRDYDAVLRAVRGVDTVFHLAALIGIPYSYVSPLAYIRTNVEGTYNVLEASRQAGTGSVIVTSTSETYGTAQTVPINEKHPAVAQSPYAATKVAADQLALSYWRSFSLPVKVARPFNTYGPRQSARAIIPAVITQLMAGARTLQLGNLAPTRDLTFVKDTVAGFLAVAACDAFLGEAVNIGMNAEISMADLVREIASVMNREVDLQTDAQRVRPASSEVERLRCDNAKLASATGWAPAYDLRRGLEETVRWFSSNARHYRPGKYQV